MLKTLRKFGSGLALASTFATHAFAAPTPASAPPAVTPKSRLDNHVVRSIAFWKTRLLKPLDERFGEASTEFVDFLRIDNENQGWKQRPKALVPDKDLVRDLRKALVDLPPRVKTMMKNKLLGVYVVEDLGGSAITEYVRDEKGNFAYGVIALDGKALNKKANDWASWKESSPYQADPLVKIEAEIEEHIYNDRAAALQYILLHEIGHVVAIGRKDLLDPSARPESGVDFGTMPFLATTWVTSKKGWVSRFDRTTFPQRPYVRYYADSSQKLPATTALAVYKNLEKTNFLTPYGSTNPRDDFADAFASYVHTQWMRRPWSIKYIYQGKIEFAVKPCWDTARCEERQRLLETILSQK